MKINLKRLKALKRLRVLTLAEVRKIDGKAGDYSVSIRIKPALCERKLHRCGQRRDSESAQLRLEQDEGSVSAACHGLSAALRARCFHHWHAPDADKAKAVCNYGAIDLGMKGENIKGRVASG